MHGFSSYTAVRATVLALMVLSASGFTTVIHYCTMSHSSQCCCAGNQSRQAERPTTGATVETNGRSCDVQVVAGGLTPVALNAASESAAHDLLSGPAVLEPVFLDILPTDVRQYSFLHTDGTAPPQAEIYIRTCSLLI